MNAVLHCLVIVPPLTAFLASPKFGRALKTVGENGSRGKLARAFQDLVSQLNHGRSKAVKPTDFRKVLNKWMKRSGSVCCCGISAGCGGMSAC
jgi:ubiquitin C-terminal hydrolase